MSIEIIGGSTSLIGAEVDENGKRTITFYVPGEAQPAPKLVPMPNARHGMRPRDKDGRKAAWKQNVILHATLAMRDAHMRFFPGAIRLGVEIRRRHSKWNKNKLPVTRPDWSNFYYYIENILQGVIYSDDSKIIGPLPGDKLWATDERPEGAYITVEEV